MRNQFGQAAGVIAVGTAAANIGVAAHHAQQVKKLQKQFQRRLDSDQQKIEFIKNIVLRYRSLGERLVQTKDLQPGTKAFEAALKQALVNEMVYNGYCNADIYVPMGPEDKPGRPRPLFGKFTRSGYVKSDISKMPPDVGLHWASGCKGAQEDFSRQWADKYRGTRQFERLKTHKEDIGITDLFIRYGTGLFLAAAILLALKVQRKVIKSQGS